MKKISTLNSSPSSVRITLSILCTLILSFSSEATFSQNSIDLDLLIFDPVLLDQITGQEIRVKEQNAFNEEGVESNEPSTSTSKLGPLGGHVASSEASSIPFGALLGPRGDLWRVRGVGGRGWRAPGPLLGASWMHVKTNYHKVTFGCDLEWTLGLSRLPNYYK